MEYGLTSSDALEFFLTCESKDKVDGVHLELSITKLRCRNSSENKGRTFLAGLPVTCHLLTAVMEDGAEQCIMHASRVGLP